MKTAKVYTDNPYYLVRPFWFNPFPVHLLVSGTMALVLGTEDTRVNPA